MLGGKKTLFEDLYLNKKSASHVLPVLCTSSGYQIKLLKEKRQLVCSYLCTPCTLNNPSVSLLFVPSYPCFFRWHLSRSFSPNLLHAVHISLRPEPTESLLRLLVSTSKHYLKQVASFSPPTKRRKDEKLGTDSISVFA